MRIILFIYFIIFDNIDVLICVILWNVKLRNGRNHGSKNLVEERQLLRKINHIRGEVKKNQKSSANLPTEPATRVYTWQGDILYWKEALTNYIKVCRVTYLVLRNYLIYITTDCINLF